MNTPIEPEQIIPALPRTQTVVMGRQGLFTVLRLIGVELYKLRRRMMSKVLMIIAILSAIIPLPLLALVTPDPLRLADTIAIDGQILNLVGVILIIILAGTIVGGEYSVGTVRLMLTRGPTRTQFFLAKLGAILTCIIIGVVCLVLLSGISVLLLNLLRKVGLHFDFFANVSVLSIISYLLATILGLFMYATMACCLSSLGKATVAGVAGTILWWVLESLLTAILQFLGGLNRGLLGDFLKAVPDYFIGHNIEVLIQNVQLGSNNMPAGSSLAALLVLAFYLILFTGLTWWVNERRDIIN